MAPLHPTRLSDDTSSTYDSVLDIFLIKNINNINQPKTINALSSDHLPVTITINETLIKETTLYLD